MAARRASSAVVAAGLLGGVRADQVVQGVPARGVLGDQVGTGQLGEVPAGLRQPDTGQAGCGGARDVRAGVQAEQPEHPGGAAVRCW